uniref:Replication protein A 70 kDa DNA-binding subunit B/D first OB fold domain-containing protein n=1 Tax=Leersia perrieri TaxID=77586 RepID=A0A0D9UWM4_9ORYZ
MKRFIPSSPRSGQSSVRKSFKYCSDEEEFTPLSQLTNESRGCRVRVRISRIWESFNPNDGTIFGLDSLLIDDKGDTMQARVPPGSINQFKWQLVEGKVYVLSGFMVEPKLKNFMTCRNGLMMYIRSQTVVAEIGDVDSIPLHSFEFVDFGDLSSRNGNNSLLTDVIGRIVYVDVIRQAPKTKPLRAVQYREITIQDLSGKTQIVTLYDDLGCHFDVELVLKKGLEAPVIAIFAGTCIRYYNGEGFMVCSTSASKYYLDFEIAEVQEFCANLSDPKNPIGHQPSDQESNIDLIQELLSNQQTIEQLKNLRSHNAKELQKTSYLCRACLKDIDCTRGWWYLGCFHCKRYKLNAMLEDHTGSMNFLIFGEQAQDIIGVAAEDLVKGIEDDDSNTFHVACCMGQYVVKGILDEDDLALAQLHNSVSSVKTEAAESGLLSQEEGCSSLVSEEKVVVKVETDLKTDSEAKQADAKEE